VFVRAASEFPGAGLSPVQSSRKTPKAGGGGADVFETVTLVMLEEASTASLCAVTAKPANPALIIGIVWSGPIGVQAAPSGL